MSMCWWQLSSAVTDGTCRASPLPLPSTRSETHNLGFTSQLQGCVLTAAQLTTTAFVCMPHPAGLQPGDEMWCDSCGSKVTTKLRTPHQAVCPNCGELLFDLDSEAQRNDLGIDAGEGRHLQ